MKCIISEKGQVTVPKACRDRLGLSPGTAIDFEAAGGKLIGVKCESTDVFRKWRGRCRIPVGGTVDEYLAKVRGA